MSADFYLDSLVASYQGPNALDATLNYPMYNSLVEAFAIPGAQNMSAVTSMMAQQRATQNEPDASDAPPSQFEPTQRLAEVRKYGLFGD